MDTINRMIAIRKRLGWEQEVLSMKMGYEKSYWHKFEAEDRKINDDVIHSFKKAVGAPLLPLTDEEDAAFKKRLYAWKDTIFFGSDEKAIELHRSYARVIELVPDAPYVVLYKIFELGFFRITNKEDELAVGLAALRLQAASFDDEQAYWFHRQLAAQALVDEQYPTAVKESMLSIKYGESTGLLDDTVYYRMGRCLSSMSFAIQALEYLDKATALLNKGIQSGNRVWIRTLAAGNYAKIGRQQEALDILEQCLTEQLQKEEYPSNLAIIYHRFAQVHLLLGDIKNVFKYLDKVSECTEKKGKSYQLSFLTKAKALMVLNEKKEALTCLDEGLSLTKEGSLFYFELMMTKHLYTLNNAKSVEFIIEQAIPSLQSMGMYGELLDCYDGLCNHFADNRSYKKALHYSRLANEIRKDLMKGALPI